GISAGFLLYILSKVTADLSKAELMHPGAAAWVPVLFGAVTGFVVLLYQEDGGWPHRPPLAHFACVGTAGAAPSPPALFFCSFSCSPSRRARPWRNSGRAPIPIPASTRAGSACPAPRRAARDCRRATRTRRCW